MPHGGRDGRRDNEVGQLNGLELRGLVWDAEGGPHELDHVTVPVRRGGRAVVVAPAPVAGALADVVCGLARPVSGQVLVHDRDVTGRPPSPGRIALVPVGGGLLPHLTVGRNIAFTLPGRDARADVVVTLARRLQLDGALDLPPHRLSAEQRLRVAVARALGRWPSALVIEDRHGQVPCAQAARAAARENVAVLVITDSAARAEEVSSRVYAARPVVTPGTAQEATDDAVGADG